ncbi:Uncharacterised protein [Neisseria meningitidis]|nr:Uncharacterised protein [Neisseria meningitidis]
MLEQGIEALRDTRRPIAVVFQFRSVRHIAVRRVALDTDFAENLFALAFADGDAVAHRQLSDRLDTGLRCCFRSGIDIAERAAARQLNQEIKDCNNNNDTAHKGKQCRALGFVVAELFHLVGLAVRLGCAVNYSLVC